MSDPFGHEGGNAPPPSGGAVAGPQGVAGVAAGDAARSGLRRVPEVQQRVREPGVGPYDGVEGDGQRGVLLAPAHEAGIERGPEVVAAADHDDASAGPSGVGRLLAIRRRQLGDVNAALDDDGGDLARQAEDEMVGDHP